jgi:diguanylate cyclase (GGDEF)-like protein
MAPITPRFDELKASPRLASPPGLAAEIMRVLGQPVFECADLARLAQADPASAGRLLQRANSNWLGRPTASVPEAIRRLGVEAARSTILDFSVLEKAAGAAQFDYYRFWSRSYARALAAYELAARSEIVCPHEAFGCALLARVGELILATVYPAECSRLLAQAQSTAESSTEQDTRGGRFGINASQLSAAILVEWRLPGFFIDAILKSASPPKMAGTVSSRLEQIASLLRAADEVALRCLDESDPSTQPPAVINRLAVHAADQARICESVRAEFLKWKQLYETIPGSTAKPRPESKPLVAVSEPRPKPLQVLVAEDNIAQRKLISRVLMSAGHSVVACEDGETALRMAASHQPDVVLSDWQMPGLDGLELCSALRRTVFGKSIYFILITGESDDALVLDAFERGVDDFIAKPLSPKVLHARMKAAQRLTGVESQIRDERAKLRQLASELADANRKLESASVTDFLTGLPNRRHFIQQLDQLWSASARRNRNLACLLIDVDHFKSVNDRYGHSMGDAVLQELAAILLGQKRSEDVICRYGGEEFAVLLPESDLEVAFRVAERFREATERESRAQLGTLSEPITVSVGLAVRSIDTQSASDLLDHADQALYRAKREGRNRTCVLPAAELSVHS